MMPSQGIQARSKQLETMAGLIHDLGNLKELYDAISACINIETGHPKQALNQTEQAFIREVYPCWKRNTQLSKIISSQSLSKATSSAQHVWQMAREKISSTNLRHTCKHLLIYP